MVGDATSHDEQGAVCPWCSASLPAPDTATCPGCGATLIEPDLEEDVPGVTTLDPEFIARANRSMHAAEPTPRRGLLSWLGAETETSPPSDLEGSVEPPSVEVRREMLRLEMEALIRDAEAERSATALDLATDSAPADRAVDTGEPAAVGEPAAGGAGAAAADAVTAVDDAANTDADVTSTASDTGDRPA